jgi:acyl-CoA thioester hydrolase
MKPVQKNRSNYIFFKEYETRWRDNDVYGHMNNVVFYEFVDSIVNHWLNLSGGLSVPNSEVVGLVVETKCNYFSSLGFPHPVLCGLSVSNIGNTSVTYEVGLFDNSKQSAAAQVSFVHVYVDCKTHKTVALPQTLLVALNKIKTN